MLVFGPVSTALTAPGVQGALFVDPVLHAEIVGVTGTGGEITTELTVPGLGLEAVPAYLQAVFVDFSGEIAIGAPTQTLLLDASL